MQQHFTPIFEQFFGLSVKTQAKPAAFEHAQRQVLKRAAPGFCLQ